MVASFNFSDRGSAGIELGINTVYAELAKLRPDDRRNLARYRDKGNQKLSFHRNLRAVNAADMSVLAFLREILALAFALSWSKGEVAHEIYGYDSVIHSSVIRVQDGSA